MPSGSSSRSYAISGRYSVMVFWLLTPFLHANLVLRLILTWVCSTLSIHPCSQRYSPCIFIPPPSCTERSGCLSCLYRSGIPRIIDSYLVYRQPSIVISLYTQQYSEASNPNITSSVVKSSSIKQICDNYYPKQNNLGE